MKDKPTTRRPPAGLGMDDPDPLGSGAVVARQGLPGTSQPPAAAGFLPEMHLLELHTVSPPLQPGQHAPRA